jgi:hypothetical protein
MASMVALRLDTFPILRDSLCDLCGKIFSPQSSRRNPRSSQRRSWLGLPSTRTPGARGDHLRRARFAVDSIGLDILLSILQNTEFHTHVTS